MNNKIRKDNVSGCKGVNWSTAAKKWRVRIFKSGKEITVGYFINFNDAVHARNKAAQEVYGDFARV